jgi:hypothetical protein
MKTTMLKIMNKRFLGFIILAILIGFFLAGFWPFNFAPKNEVKWLRDTNGISLYGKGFIYTPHLLNDQKPISLKNPITIELWLQPNIEPDLFVARILSLYDSDKSEEFFIGQWKNDLILGNHIIEPSNNKTYKEVGLDNILTREKGVFITITSGNEGTTIYIDGKEVESYPKFSLIDDNPSSGYLIIGNSPMGKQYWTGDIYGLAIYNNLIAPVQVLKNYNSWIKNGFPDTLEDNNNIALYLFDEKTGALVKNHAGSTDLMIPKTFIPLKRTFLSLNWGNIKFNRSFFKDNIINLFGFIPFGFFFLALLWKTSEVRWYRISMMVILSGGVLSLIIELIQVYLPSRSSSLIDLILNTVGTGVGVLLFNIISGKLEN